MARPALLWSLVTGALALLGCSSHHDPPAAACTHGASDVQAALHAAPGPVTLPGRTSLADCVGAAREASDLQNVGAVFVDAASHLALVAPRDPRAALRLGYLVGAVERGADRTAGLQAELVNRIESTLSGAGLQGVEHAAAMRGRAAGRAHG